MIGSIPDFMQLVDAYSAWLWSNGCKFNAEGFPVMERSWYLDKWPDQMATYRARGARFIDDKSKTVLCLYCEDARIYPRLEKLMDDVNDYRRYMGVVSADLTITADMDIEWQEEVLLANQMFAAILALNGVKIVQNLRIGSQRTLHRLGTVPHGVMCASGTLGCDVTSVPYDLRYSEKIFYTRPSGVLIYGKRDPIMEQQLDIAGVPHRLYRDAHTLYKASGGE